MPIAWKMITNDYTAEKSVINVEKYQILQKWPNFNRLERPPKINIFEKNFAHLIFIGKRTFLTPGSKTFRKKNFGAIFGPP